MINKFQYSKIKNKTILHKVKKHWVAISVALLSALGLSNLSTLSIHADNVHNQPYQQTSQVNNSFKSASTTTQRPKSNSVSTQINNKASQITTQILNNSKQSTQSSNVSAPSYQHSNSNQNISNFSKSVPTANTDSQNISHVSHGFGSTQKKASTPTNNIVTGTLGTVNYQFNNQDGTFNTTSSGKIDPLCDLSTGPNHINLNNIKHVNITQAPVTIDKEVAPIQASDPSTHKQITLSCGLFGHLPNVSDINATNLQLNSNTKTMNGMFENDPNLKDIKLNPNIDTSNVKLMSFLFASDKNLRNINDIVQHFNTQNVLDMKAMFEDCEQLKALSLPQSFNTRKVIDMSGMFDKDNRLSDIKFDNNFDTTNVRNMNSMFSTTNLHSLDLSNFNTQEAASIQLKINSDEKKNIKLNPKVIKNNGMNNIFKGDASLQTLKLGPKSPIITSTSDWYKVLPPTSSEKIYTNYRPSNLGAPNTVLTGTYVTTPNVNPSINISGAWGTTKYNFNPSSGLLQTTTPGTITPLVSKVKNKKGQFVLALVHPSFPKYMTNLIKTIQFTSGTVAPSDSTYLFASPVYNEHTTDGMKLTQNYYPNLSTIDLTNLDTSHVKNMNGMFMNQYYPTHIIFGKHFNTSNVSSMIGMFMNNRSLNNDNNLDLSDFDTSKVTNMAQMFENDYALTHINFGKHFDTSNVSSTERMFDNDYSLSDLDLGPNFNTNKVTSMDYMFYNNSNLKNLNLENHFNTSNVKVMNYMFYNDSDLPQLNLGNQFNTQNVLQFSHTFTNDSGLTSLDLGNQFYTGQAHIMNNMFQNDNKLQTLNFGNHFDTTKAANQTTTNNMAHGMQDQGKAPHQAKDKNGKLIFKKNGKPLIIMGPDLVYTDGVNNMFTGDNNLNTLIMNNTKLTDLNPKLKQDMQKQEQTNPSKNFIIEGLNLPIPDQYKWYLNNKPINLTNGQSYSGTAKLLTTQKPVQTTITFKDTNRPINTITVTGLNNTPISYFTIADALGSDYKLNINPKDFMKTYPNTSYYYKQGTITIPVKKFHSIDGGAPTSSSKAPNSSKANSSTSTSSNKASSNNSFSPSTNSNSPINSNASTNSSSLHPNNSNKSNYPDINNSNISNNSNNKSKSTNSETSYKNKPQSKAPSTVSTKDRNKKEKQRSIKKHKKHDKKANKLNNPIKRSKLNNNQQLNSVYDHQTTANPLNYIYSSSGITRDVPTNADNYNVLYNSPLGHVYSEKSNIEPVTNSSLNNNSNYVPQNTQNGNLSTPKTSVLSSKINNSNNNTQNEALPQTNEYNYIPILFIIMVLLNIGLLGIDNHKRYSTRN